MDLHGKIINIQIKSADIGKAVELGTACDNDLESRLTLVYKIGHRDARHESAELAVLSQVKTIDIFKSWLEKNNISYDTIDVNEWINEINEE